MIIYRNDLSVVVKCLQMLFRQSWVVDHPERQLEIVVLDNDDGNQLKTLERLLNTTLPKAQRERITLMGSPNVGFGAGHNRIFQTHARKGRTDYYLCVNPDGIPHPLLLERLIGFAQAHDNQGLFEARQFPEEHPKTYDPVTGEAEWVSGCCLLVPDPVYRALAGFDELFFLYVEDVDLSWRAKGLGLGCYTVQDALFCHFLDKNRDTRFSTRQLRVAAYQLAMKYGHEPMQRALLREMKELFAPNELEAVMAKLEAQRPRFADAQPAPYMNFTQWLHFSQARW
jgi:GT2 family glycosyltransferase